MSDTDGAGGTERRRKWSGYSDYKKVASQLHDDINTAVDAYSHVDSMNSQNVGITPQTAVKARSAIVGISKRIFVEIKRNRRAIDGFEDIYSRWAGEELDDGEWADAEDEGYIERLDELDFTRNVPPWLGQLVDDLIEAGWALGYLKAGREETANPEADLEQVKEMFE